MEEKKMKRRFACIAVCLIALLIILFYYMFHDVSSKERKTDKYVSIKECVYSVNTLFGENIADASEIQSGKNETNMTKDNVLSLIKKLGREDELIQKAKSSMSDEKYVTRKEWGKVLTLIVQSCNMQEICGEEEFDIFDVRENENGEDSVSIVTDGRLYSYYKGNDIVKSDRRVNAFVRDDQIIFITDYKNAGIKYENVLIRKTDNEIITVSLNGGSREITVKGLNENLTNILADIEINNGKVTALILKRESISGKVLAVADDSIEIEGFGKVMLSVKCRYYIGYKDYEESSKQSVLVGADNLRFMVADKNICGIIVQNDVNAKDIRVLLKSTGYTSLFHDNASLSCQSRYRLSYYTKDEAGTITELVTEHEPGEVLEITPESEMLVNGRMTVTPMDENAKTVVNSISRNGTAPEYRGTIEVSNYEGKLVLINELPLEEYLYAVVPSEMPSSYGVEALKVQAVCARSYAVSHLGDNKLSKYGAQVDDSTDYQVYNNTKETENSISAVKATYGEVLKCGDEIANTYFFATSCGSTADSAIWGGNPLPYIQGKLLSQDGNTLDLTNNEVFSEFIKEEYESFDKGTAWYRWNITMTDEQLSKAVNGNLGGMYQKYPDKILTRLADGTFESRQIDTVGNVQNITVLSRLTGGVIEELLIEGDKAAVKVMKQSTIRNLISPYKIPINKCDGTSVDTFQALPSAFFTVEAGNGTVTFYGGGYGHGAGMSQTAVKNMIGSGMTYDEILTFFYTGVEIGYY